MRKDYKLINNIMGWLIGIFASAIYIMTAEPTASWWDCGEYISTAYKLLVGHPPGAPTFQLLGRVASMFAGGDVTKVAFCINCMSAICSGLTIMFLFWTITMLGRKLVEKSGEMTTGKMLAVFGSALVGSLTYTFTDTFWFSAVEGEVYAMSSFFTALVFWCILKWDFEYDHPKANANPNRWIILIAYLIGLSVGVHLLNLLTIPAVVLIVYFKLSKKATVWGVVQTIAILSLFAAVVFPVKGMIAIWLLVTIPLTIVCIKKGTFSSKAEWGILIALIGSFLLLAVILFLIIPGIVSWAGKFEIFFVNSIGLPFNSGTMIFFLFLAGLVTWGLWYGYKKMKPNFLTAIFSFIFILIGYSTFFILVIRSNADPTIDENNPENAVSLLSYLNREQYGDFPVLYGKTYNSRPTDYKDGNPTYVQDEKSGKYIVCDARKKTIPIYGGDQSRFMPRMYDSEKRDNYIRWLYENEPAKLNKKMSSSKLPGYEENIEFMHTYQFYYMSFRYFMWNFSGRQNDIQGSGGELNGNWITGISSLDKIFLGEQADIPSHHNKGNNKYYMLPLILGLIGAFFYARRDGKNSFIVLLLFLMTGLAIAFYLNMPTFQPRERDYAFAASFYAFSIWIGFGVYAIYSLFEKIKNKTVQIVAPVLITLICIGLVPGIMASENWDDHNRANRYTALAAAKNYLDSCAPNAIIFTMGDNDTFPLWYAQEVEGYRTDVRVCNLSLLSAGWYVDQMKRKAYQSEPLPISMTWEQYKDGTRNGVIFADGNDQFVDLKTVMKIIKKPEFNGVSLLNCNSNSGYSGQYVGQDIPSSFSLPVDKQKVLSTHTVGAKDADKIVDRIEWNTKDFFVPRSFLIMMDILANNNWERPIYFASTMGPDGYFGLEEYFQLEGLAYRLIPIKTQGARGRIDSDILYHNVMEVFDDHTRIDKVNQPNATPKAPYPYAWGGINDPRVYNSEDNLRTCLFINTIHYQLAEQLFRENKLDSAQKVIEHFEKILPDELIPSKLNSMPGFTNYKIQMINIYDRINPQKAKVLRDKMLKHIQNELQFFEQTDQKTRQIHYAEIEDIFFEYLPALTTYNKNLPKLELKAAGTILLTNSESKLEKSSNELKELMMYRSQIQQQQAEPGQEQMVYNEMMKNENMIQTKIRDIYQTISLMQTDADIFKLSGNNQLATKAIELFEKYRKEIAPYISPDAFQ